jgi:hypothetical protein
MRYLLLGIESLTCTFLFVAVAMACIARLGGRWRRLALATVVILLPFALYTALTTLDAIVEIHYRVQAGWFWPAVALTLSYLVGAIVILNRGLTRDPVEERPAAASWPPGKLALALAAALMLHGMTFANLDANVKQNLATVRAEATALALSVAPVRLPEQDNAAVVYQQAFEAIGWEFRGGPVRRWPQVWHDAAKVVSDGTKSEFNFRDPELGAFLAERAGELSVIRIAAARPGCFFDRDYGRPTFDMLLPEMQDLRTAAELLAIHARWTAEHGDVKTALVDVNAIYGIARHAGSEPILVSLMVSASIDQMADTTLTAALRGKHPSADELAQLQIDGSVSYQRMLGRALRMEEAFILNSFAGLDDMDVGTLAMMTNELAASAYSHLGILYRVFLLNEDVAASRETMREFKDLAAKPYAQFRSGVQQLQNELRQSPPGIVTGLLMPTFGPAIETAFRADASRHLAEIALAMHRYYAVHGKFPDKTDALSPEDIALVPRDPFNDQPIQLKTTATGWILSSIGSNLKHDADQRRERFGQSVQQGYLTCEYVEPQPPSEEKPTENK